MANITPKSKTVKGTKKKDTITWKSSSAKYKAITVNALADNDVINFKKSKYNNKLNGQDGNDTIYGGTKNDTINGGKGNDKLYGYQGNDKIYGGTGNDYINAGKGTNTIYLNKKEGTDTVVKGGGSDTVVFAKEKNFNNFMFYYSANDLLFKAGGSTAKLKDFAKGGHSVKYVQAGKLKYKLSGKTGTTKNDLIVAKNTNNTINAGAGNDIIYGGKGNDVINAGTGADIIYGGEGDDIIYGDKGSDTINAGTGRNTIYHNSGDGNDVIVAGGGKDKLSFGGVNSINDITTSITDNDVVFSTPNGETVTLQNVLINEHSVDTIEIGDDKYTTDRFKNSIISHDDITYGTAWHDDIQVYNLTSSTPFPEIYAGAGNDIIYVSPFSQMPKIYVGAGDDTVSLVYDGSHNTIKCKIFFENGDGNNTLTGLSNNLSTSSQIYIFSDDLYHGIRLSDTFSYNYVTGTQDGNNLVLALTGGETFTIENYYDIDQDIRSLVFVEENGDTNILSKYLKSEGDIITVDAEPNEIYEIEESSNKLIIAPEADFCRFIDISDNSNNNDIVIKGQEETLEVYSSNNNIYLGGGSHSVQLYGDGLTGNKIYFYADGGSIRTSDGGSTFISAKTDGYTSISSFGTDTLYLEKGQHYIHFDSNYDETVTIGKESKEVQIYGVEVAKSTKITQQSTGKTVTDIMFEHYTNWKDSYNNDYLSVKYFDKNGAVLNGDDNNELLINGKWEDNIFNLDNATVGDKVTVVAGLETKTLSQMTQYVDMTNSSLNKLFKFADKTQNGLLDNRAGVYIKGSDSQDYYTGYTFANGKVTINDAGGRGDLNDDFLRLDMARNSYRFFIDIDKNGNSASNGDMFIFTHNTDPNSEEGWLYDGLWQHLNGNDDNINAYVKIEGQVDASEGGGVPDIWYLPDGQIEYINDNDKTGGGFNLSSYFFNINMDVAGWLNSYNSNYDTECNSISEAILDGKATGNELNTLYNLYCDNTNWANY